MRILPINPKVCIEAEGIKHSTKLKKDHTKSKDNSRIQHVELIKQNPNIKKILCIGARDNSEVLSFINAGFNATGIDVTPESKYVKKLDAHEMDYKNNEFDFVYASHVLEHLYNPKLVMKKIRKISKYGIFIILPITDKLRVGHPAIFNIMGNPPAEYTVPDSDFNSFLPNHVIKHYKITGTKEKDFEIMFTWSSE
jgi:hypothetical protein